MSAGLVALTVRFVVMAIATFLAIVVWSRLRDAAWMLIVVGIIAGYADILYSMLLEFGLVRGIDESLGGGGVLGFVFPNLPWLFFSAAFITIIARHRPRD
ncbi:MAG: hypothetical protein CVV51_12145 [Spirochaetae bacterium HGW-Spirochaetae-7]|jgi:hypothetical protein|nr:MAG: hypothetical protein CVV51_12145 [Spirochaetae bacterium HGW-Spirochaetae-7]